MKFSVIMILVAVSGLLLLAGSGCVPKSQYDACVSRNATQAEQMATLEQQAEQERQRADQLMADLKNLQAQQGLYGNKENALRQALAAAQAEIARLSGMVGVSALPTELSNELEAWAKETGSDLVSYDPKTGIVRFNTDLLFNKGDDTVAEQFVGKLQELAKILSSSAAEGFDALIVGHTDDIPIQRAETRAKHPTNWHLSAHRAISVERVMNGGGMPETRMTVAGMGEFHPIAPNAAGRKGNAQNRRVEIYIVPSGQIRISTIAPAATAAPRRSAAAADLPGTTPVN